MYSDLLNQLTAAVYQWTSFEVGSFNFADMALNFQSAFLDSSMVFAIKIISGILTIGFGIAAFFLIMRRKEFDKKTAAEAAQTAVESDGSALAPLQEQWNDILRHIDSTREGEWKFAIIEADKITDDVLRNYFPGDSMGERLKNIDKTKLLAIDDLWEAHKIRNRLAHDSNYFLRHAEALRAIRLYESALRELEVIS